MTLRVLHVLDHSAPLHSGYTFRTLAILREQRRLGWQTLQLTTPKQGPTDADEETVDGFTFLRTRLAPGAGLLRQMTATSRRLAAAVERFAPDLIHAHSPLLTALPSLYAAMGRRLPVVYEMRASWEDAAVDNGSTTPGSLRYRLSRRAETFVFRRASQVTTISEGLRSDIASRGIAEDKITCIPNAVDIDRFVYRESGDPEARRQLGLGGSATVGFIGSFYKYEGIDLLLEAVAQMRAAGEDVRALLVGGGPEEDNLKGLANTLGIEGAVAFVGRVDQAEVQRYYAAIDILGYARRSTRLTEIVTPLKPLEAMAQGNLFVASDVGGHRELIRNGDTGVLFKADDVASLVAGLRKLFAERDRWAAMRRRAREFVTSERTWERSVAAYRGVYARALSAVGRQVSL